MTGRYDWNPMPHRVDVKCPRCAARAEFEFAEVHRIELKKDVPFFRDSPLFEYRMFQDSCGHYWHGAIFYAGLHGDPQSALHELPAGYEPRDWSHSKYLYRSGDLDLGSVRCEHCHLRAKHTLRWPEDAYFSLSYRNQVLWAFHRESASDLRDYLLSTSREVSRYRWSSFLLHVPTVFKTHKARAAVTRHLLSLLAGTTQRRRAFRAISAKQGRMR